jgi:hypothetical protein
MTLVQARLRRAFSFAASLLQAFYFVFVPFYFRDGSFCSRAGIRDIPRLQHRIVAQHMLDGCARLRIAMCADHDDRAYATSRIDFEGVARSVRSRN